MNRRWIVLVTGAAVALAFVASVMVFKNRAGQEVALVAETNSGALIGPQAPV